MRSSRAAMWLSPASAFSARTISGALSAPSATQAQPRSISAAVGAKKATIPVGSRESAVQAVSRPLERPRTSSGAAATHSSVSSISHRSDSPDSSRMSIAAAPPARTGRTSPPVTASAMP